MTNGLLITIIALFVILLGIATAITIILSIQIKLLNKSLEKNQKEMNIAMIEYSDKLLDYVREINIQIAAFHFNKFIYGRDLSTVTKESLKKVIDKVATDTFEYVDNNNIDFRFSLITEKMYREYIIETSIYVINDMFNKELNKAIGGN